LGVAFMPLYGRPRPVHLALRLVSQLRLMPIG